MTAKKRPSLFSFGREAELAHLDQWIAGPADRDVCVAAVDAFLNVVRTRHLPMEWLTPIATAVVHPAAEVRAFTITKLTVLAHYFEDACAVLGAICTHPNPEIRAFAFGALSHAPETSWPPLLADGLHDEVWQVRRAAALVCTTSRSPVLAQLVEQALLAETDARVQVVLQNARRFQSASVPSGSGH